MTKKKEIVEKLVKCPRCEGVGWKRDPDDDEMTLTFCFLCKSEGTLIVSSEMRVCGKCSGKGLIIVLQRHPIMGRQEVLVKCNRCDGKCIVKVNKNEVIQTAVQGVQG